MRVREDLCTIGIYKSARSGPELADKSLGHTSTEVLNHRTVKLCDKNASATVKMNVSNEGEELASSIISDAELRSRDCRIESKSDQRERLKDHERAIGRRWSQASV